MRSRPRGHGIDRRFGRIGQHHLCRVHASLPAMRPEDEADHRYQQLDRDGYHRAIRELQ